MGDSVEGFVGGTEISLAGIPLATSDDVASVKTFMTGKETTIKKRGIKFCHVITLFNVSSFFAF